MLRVTPLYGSSCSKEEPDAPYCTLIEYSGTKLLVNVGWTTKTPPDMPTPDCVLLTDSTLQSIGGLPGWWWDRFGRDNDEKTNGAAGDTGVGDKDPIPIFATFPTVKMGQMTLYDQHAALCMDGGKPPFTLEAVDDCVSRITAIKYSQHISVNNGELKITAYSAGHTVGGAFFVLKRPHDETVVVVTPSKYNTANELVLNRSSLLQSAASPDVLITYPGYQPPFVTPSNTNSSVSSTRLTDAVLTVLRKDGNVLLPADASGRCLELLLQLNQHWESQRLQSTYNFVWFSPLAHNVHEFARSQLEWTRLQFGTGAHPLELSAVQRCTSAAELDALMQRTNNPTCVVASGLNMDAGPARDVFLRFAEGTENAILFTDTSQCYLRSTMGIVTPSTVSFVVDAEQQEDLVGEPVDIANMSPWTAAAQLLQLRDHDDSSAVSIDVPVSIKLPLTGSDLREFGAREEAARQATLAAREQRAMLAQVELAKGQLHLGEAETSTAQPKQHTTAVSRPRKKITFDVREEAPGIGQDQVIAKFGIGEANRNVLEDDYGIAAKDGKFSDILPVADQNFFGRLGDKKGKKGGIGGTKNGPRVVSEDEEGDSDDMDEELMEVMDLSEGQGIIRGRNGRPPTKVTTVMRKIEVLAEVSYIPGLEGRVDASKARKSVRALQPREVVVLGGRSSNDVKNDRVAALAEAAKSFSTGSQNVLTPSNGETAEISVGRAAYSIQLIDVPYQEDKDASPLPPVEFHESKLGVCNVGAVNCVATGDIRLADNSLVLAPQPKSANMPSVYVSHGEVLLTDLRTELISTGLKAEYSTAAGYSQLLVNGKIVVRKDNQSGRINIDGPLCEDFYAVRSILCAQYLTI